MNANLLTNDHLTTGSCAQRTDLLTTDHAVKNICRNISALKPMMRLMLALTVLLGLMAARPAHAQNLNLGYYTNILTLTDASTKKSTTAYLDVIQDKYGNLTGWLVKNNTDYKVTGTLTWYGGSWYWLDITATYTSQGFIYSYTTFELSDWVTNEGGGEILFGQNNYTWDSSFGFYFSNGGGYFSGFGFQTPQ
jgi:hypothetical protein